MQEKAGEKGEQGRILGFALPQSAPCATIAGRWSSGKGSEKGLEKGAAGMSEEERERVLKALETIRCPAACTEMELHEQAARAFERFGLPARHEVALGPRCRIDFMVGGIGVEIKKSRPQPAALISQLRRYAACAQVEELIVVAPRGVNLPKTALGKRVTMVGLERLWGISLP